MVHLYTRHIPFFHTDKTKQHIFNIPQNLFTIAIMAVLAYLEKPIKSLFNLFDIEIAWAQRTPAGNIWTFFRHLKKREFQCNHFLDVGAHEADVSKMAISFFPNATIYMVEPLEEMRPQLENFCKKNPKSRLFNFAVGAENSKQELNIFNDLGWSGFMDNDVQAQYKKKSRTVEIRTIDDLIRNKEMEIPDLVKLDVQGFELEVLKGASSLFGKTELFIMEVSLQNKHKSVPLIADVIAFMKERDYFIYDFVGFLRQPEDDALVECDICFVKRDSFLRK